MVDILPTIRAGSLSKELFSARSELRKHIRFTFSNVSFKSPTHLVVLGLSPVDSAGLKYSAHCQLMTAVSTPSFVLYMAGRQTWSALYHNMFV